MLMQTINFSGFGKTLQPQKGKKTMTDRLIGNLGKTNYGCNKRKMPLVSGKDTFSVSGLISDLVSPACGMTEEEKQAYLAKIRAKLERGEKLTAEEMRFLQAEDPVLYQQAARVMAMREALENQLKQCTSKEQAQNVYSAAVYSVSKDDPMKTCIIAAYNNVMKEYMESDEYKSLPDTEKEAKEKKTGSMTKSK